MQAVGQIGIDRVIPAKSDHIGHIATGILITVGAVLGQGQRQPVKQTADGRIQWAGADADNGKAQPAQAREHRPDEDRVGMVKGTAPIIVQLSAAGDDKHIATHKGPRGTDELDELCGQTKQHPARGAQRAVAVVAQLENKALHQRRLPRLTRASPAVFGHAPDGIGLNGVACLRIFRIERKANDLRVGQVAAQILQHRLLDGRIAKIAKAEGAHDGNFLQWTCARDRCGRSRNR